MLAVVRFCAFPDDGNGHLPSLAGSGPNPLSAAAVPATRLPALQLRISELIGDAVVHCGRYLALLELEPPQRTAEHLVPFEKLRQGFVYLHAADTARRNMGRTFTTEDFIERIERSLPGVRVAAHDYFKKLHTEFELAIVPEVFPAAPFSEMQKGVLDRLAYKQSRFISPLRILLSSALAIACRDSALDDAGLVPVARALDLTLDQFKKLAVQIGAFGAPSAWSR